MEHSLRVVLIGLKINPACGVIPLIPRSTHLAINLMSEGNVLLAVMILISTNLSLCALNVMHFCTLMVLVKIAVGDVFTICKILKNKLK